MTQPFGEKLPASVRDDEGDVWHLGDDGRYRMATDGPEYGRYGTGCTLDGIAEEFGLTSLNPPAEVGTPGESFRVLATTNAGWPPAVGDRVTGDGAATGLPRTGTYRGPAGSGEARIACDDGVTRYVRAESLRRVAPEAPGARLEEQRREAQPGPLGLAATLSRVRQERDAERRRVRILREELAFARASRDAFVERRDKFREERDAADARAKRYVAELEESREEAAKLAAGRAEANRQADIFRDQRDGAMQAHADMARERDNWRGAARRLARLALSLDPAASLD